MVCQNVNRPEKQQVQAEKYEDLMRAIKKVFIFGAFNG
jgi:hypothetical protein